MKPTTVRPTARPRRRRVVAATVVAATLTVAGAGAAMAAAPDSAVSQAVAGVLQDAGVDWSFMPDGYTQEQYEAFWGAGYTYEDVLALDELWGTGDTETKARAGQLLLDGESVPLPPSGPVEEGTEQAAEPAGEGAPPVAADPGEPAAEGDEWTGLGDRYTQEQYDAFWGAGYTAEDVVALGELWTTGPLETKARAGQLILDGQQVPVAPGSTPQGETAPRAEG